MYLYYVYRQTQFKLFNLIILKVLKTEFTTFAFIRLMHIINYELEEYKNDLCATLQFKLIVAVASSITLII